MSDPLLTLRTRSCPRPSWPLGLPTGECGQNVVEYPSPRAVRPAVHHEKGGGLLKAFLLTWNPDKTDLGMEWDELIEQPGPPMYRWSTGGRKRGIEEGDTVVFLRQQSDRGVIAVGRALGSIYQAEHWTPGKGEANYVDVTWDTVAPLADRLTTEELQMEIPDFPWGNLQGSGVQIEGEQADRLHQLWQPHARRLPPAPVQSNRPGLWSTITGWLTRGPVLRRTQHWVYLMEHPTDQAWKIGITNDRDRREDELGRDEWAAVTNWGMVSEQRSRNVEKAVLRDWRQVYEWPLGRPAGTVGYTETIPQAVIGRDELLAQIDQTIRATRRGRKAQAA